MKWLEYILNILFWLITGWLITSSFSIQRQEIEIINGLEQLKTIRNESMIYHLLIVIGVSMIVFYSNLYNIHQLNRSFLKNKVLLISMALLLFSLILISYLNPLLFAKDLPLPNQISLSIFLFYFTVSSLYALLKVWIQSEQKHKDLALQAKQAELNLLRNQLQPHFLFNALNNLLSLVDQKKSPKLSTSIERLSHLLRYVIDEIKSEKVQVSKEIKFIRNYCELQLLRFEEQEIDFSFEVYGENLEELIEPGLFISFVENAFKYGTEPEFKSYIKIEFDLSVAGEITFKVQNKLRPEMQNNTGTGIGIQSIRDRLNIVYQNNHSLEIIESEKFTVILKIKFIESHNYRR